MLDFQSCTLGELHGAVDPVHSTDKLTVGRECVLARQARSHLYPALWAVGWEGVLLDVKLDSIVPPIVGEGLTGDLKAGLCNHVNTTEVAWRGREGGGSSRRSAQDSPVAHLGGQGRSQHEAEEAVASSDFSN